MLDLFKTELIQATTTTRSIEVPRSTRTVEVTIKIHWPHFPTICFDLQGLFNGTWISIINGVGSRVSKAADRVRLVLDPSQPTSVGVVINFKE